MIILVNDVNDNKPHFLKSHFVFTVQEDAPIGYVLADQLSATDADIDVSHIVFNNDVTITCYCSVVSPILILGSGNVNQNAFVSKGERREKRV